MKQSQNIFVYTLFIIMIVLIGFIVYITYKSPKLKVMDLPKVEGEVGDVVNINLLPNTTIRDNSLIVKDGNKYLLNKEGESTLLIDNKSENVIYKAIVSVKKKNTFTGIVTDKLSIPLSNYSIILNDESPIAINDKGKFTVMISNPNKSLEGSTLSLLNKDKSKKVMLGTIQLIQHQYKLIPNQVICTVPNKDLNIIKLNIAKPKTDNAKSVISAKSKESNESTIPKGSVTTTKPIKLPN